MYNLGDKTILSLIFNRINGFVRVQNGKAEQQMGTWTANGANKKLVLHVILRCGSLSITPPVSQLANEFNVRASEPGSCQSNFVSFTRLRTVTIF